MTLKDKKNRLTEALLQLDKTKREVLDLRDEFRSYFPFKGPRDKNIGARSLLGFYLARLPDVASEVLRWRYVVNKQDLKQGVQVADANFWGIVSKQTEKNKKLISEFEYKRIQLNYSFTMLRYECDRLKSSINKEEIWTLNVKKIF